MRKRRGGQLLLFGLTADQVAGSRGWYNPAGTTTPARVRAALDLIFSDHFSRNEPGVFAPLRDTLLTRGDYYMHLADLASYLEPTSASADCTQTRNRGRARPS